MEKIEGNIKAEQNESEESDILKQFRIIEENVNLLSAAVYKQMAQQLAMESLFLESKLKYLKNTLTEENRIKITLEFSKLRFFSFFFPLFFFLIFFWVKWKVF